MKKDTILFILQVIDEEMKTANLDRQLYLFERKIINLKKLEHYGKFKCIDCDGNDLDYCVCDSLGI